MRKASQATLGGELHTDRKLIGGGPIETEMNMITEAADAADVAGDAEILQMSHKSKQQSNRYEDDGRSQDFSDTENEHFSAPVGIPTRQRRDDNVSLDSGEAQRDVTAHNLREIRSTVKTNARPVDTGAFDDF